MGILEVFCRIDFHPLLVSIKKLQKGTQVEENFIMEKKNNKEYYTIDVVHIFKTLWKRFFIILIAGMLVAALGFAISAFVIAPTYSSSIMLYVNNSSFSLGNTNFSITSSEITAAQSLVKTYSEILLNRTTLERVLEKAQLPYTYKELAKMVSAAPSNDTEIMKVVVVAEDPYEASNIANCIAEVLPTRISEIIDGASMEVVDSAVPNLRKIAPSITQYTIVGFILGSLLAVVVLVILAIMDDTIHDEEYILQNYEYPILAKIPDLMISGDKRYGYYQNYTESEHSTTAKRSE